MRRRGEIGTYLNQSQWEAWFASYQSYMTNMSKLAEKLGVDLLLIGTELTATEPQDGCAQLHVSRRAAYKYRLWNETIENAIRPHFSGVIAYGANHPVGEFQTWWQVHCFVCNVLTRVAAA